MKVLNPLKKITMLKNRTEYLQREGSEVVNMLIAEYDYDMDIEVQREEAYSEGLEEGRAEGLEEGKAEGIEKINR